MVYCQVSDLFRKFSELEEMEKNDWKISPPSLKQPKASTVKMMSFFLLKFVNVLHHFQYDRLFNTSC